LLNARREETSKTQAADVEGNLDDQDILREKQQNMF
jgi:hypothetical protein